MITQRTLYRFLFLFACIVPLGILMFIGKPARLQGLLFDIENFIGLNNVAIALVVGGCVLVGVEAFVLLFKKKAVPACVNALLILLFSFFAYFSVQNDVYYKEAKTEPTEVDHTTLIVATEGSLYNFDLDAYELNWRYTSDLDSDGNRTSFVIHEQSIFMPFESGKLFSFEVNTGEIIWKKYVNGRDNFGVSIDLDGPPDVFGLTPLFMSKPLIDRDRIVIASHGQPHSTKPYLYSFDTETGATHWQKLLPTHFNYFAPAKYRSHKFDYYFTNSAIHLDQYGSNSGSRYSFGLPDSDAGNSLFTEPLYNQMQTDRNSLYLGDESGKLYSLPLDKEARVVEEDKFPASNTDTESTYPFKWVFSDENFTSQRNQITFLQDGVLYTDIQNDSTRQSKIVAINAQNGSVKWEQIVEGRIDSWALLGNKVVGSTENTIFYVDTAGQDFTEVRVENKPLSNIDRFDDDTYLFVSERGIEQFTVNSAQTEVVYPMLFNDNHHNNVQIELISK